MKTVGIVQFARETGYSTKHITEQVQLGRIPASKQGRKWVISSNLVKVWRQRRKDFQDLLKR